MLLADAEVIGNDFIQGIREQCERVEIAGSVRRKKKEVKDIEVVATPKMQFVPQSTLFGDTSPLKEQDCLQAEMQDLLKLGIISRGKSIVDKNGKERVAPFSERYYKIIYKEAPIDLFVVKPPAQWGVIFTLRTGSAQFSHWLATRALQIGKRLNGGRLWEMGEVKGRDASDIWFTVETDTEEQFLMALGLPPIIPPQHRYLYLCQICRYGTDEPPISTKTGKVEYTCPNCSASNSLEGMQRLYNKVYTSQA